MSSVRVVGALLLLLSGCSSGPTASGVVTLIEQHSGSLELEASFAATPMVGWASPLGPQGCTLVAEVDDCAHIVCDPSFRSDDAGALEVALDGAALEPVTLTGLTYRARGLDGEMTDGTTVRLSAAGATVPTFTTDVAAPDEPEITLPFAIEPGEPLELTWTPSDAERLIVRASAPMTTGPQTRIACAVDPSAGALRIDGAITAAFEPPDMGVALAVTLETAFVDEETVMAGDYEIVVRVGHSRSAALRSNP